MAELTARKDALEVEYEIAKANEGIAPDMSDLMDWLDNMAEELTPTQILQMFVRAVEVTEAEVRLFFAFDYYGDGFTPPKYKDEHPVKGCSSNSLMVEARRIELRSILRSCSGSTSLFRDRISEDVGSRTNVELPSPFFLFQSHTDYVL